MSNGSWTDGTIAIWGTFDVANFGDHLFPRVAEHELVRRLPGWRVRSFSPFGWDSATPMDGGVVAEPLGRWSPRRIDELAAAAQLTLIGGGEILHFQDELLTEVYGTTAGEMALRRPSTFFVEGLGARHEEHHPVVWHGVGMPFVPTPEQAGTVRDAAARRELVTVRDPATLERLRACGVEGDVRVVPDSGFLLDRIVPRDVVDARISYFRFMGWLPRDRPFIVLQANRSMVPDARSTAEILGWVTDELVDAEVVLLQTGPCHGDDEFVRAVRRHFGARPVHEVPADLPPEDVVALCATAALVVAMSFHATIAAAVHGRPWVLLDFSGVSKLAQLAAALHRPGQRATEAANLPAAVRVALGSAPDPGRIRALQQEVDVHFDALAELAVRHAPGGPPATARRLAEVGQENAALRRALRLHGAKLTRDRAALVEMVVEARRAAERDLAAGTERIRRLEAELADVRAEAGAAQDELAALLRTKLLRSAAPARSVYARLRRS